ncbi:MAG: signal recognition particle receptor subunit alpha, partial [Fimbriimonadaceae bacterium]
MLDTLTRRMAGIFAGLRTKGRITEDDINEVMREVRVALLEADVNFTIAKQFIATVKERCVGEQVFTSLSADQTVIKIVRDELTALLGSEAKAFNWSSAPPTVVLMCGLQGSGKTTTCAKLALWLTKQGKKPMMAACDLQRPAAITQLQVLGESIGVPVFADTTGKTPPQVAKDALERCKHLMLDVLIVDTAGRLQVAEELMKELKQVHDSVRPTEVFLVVDST